MVDVIEQSSAVFPPRARLSAVQAQTWVGAWLAIMSALILTMVMVGGATRLTESGLSMVDWAPVTGFVPPLNEADWQAEFAKYQTSPEFKLVNAAMTLDDFKTIYHWEFWHRNLGRFLGLAFALPLMFFFAKGFVPKALAPRLILLLVLGGGQGALGWYMVQSGLVDVPEVSHYRLAAHLSMALLLFSLVWWTALDLLTRAPRKPATLNHRIIVWSFLGVLALQIVYGAFVAGLDAGYAYGTWPDMEGQFVPDEAFAGNTLWQRLTYGQGTVQFIHRMLAYGVAVFAVIIALTFPQHLADKPARLLARALVFVVLGQVVLGILTLLQGVPVFLGTLHQGWAVILLGVTVTLLHRLRQP